MLPELDHPGGGADTGVGFIVIGLDIGMVLPAVEKDGLAKADTVGACGASVML